MEETLWIDGKCEGRRVTVECEKCGEMTRRRVCLIRGSTCPIESVLGVAGGR